MAVWLAHKYEGERSLAMRRAACGDAEKGGTQSCGVDLAFGSLCLGGRGTEQLPSVSRLPQRIFVKFPPEPD